MKQARSASDVDGYLAVVPKEARAAIERLAEKGIGGRDRARTGDPLLAKQVLSQLSYTPTRRVALILRYFRPF